MKFSIKPTNWIITITVFFLTLVPYQLLFAQQLAFPTAKGAGAYVTGGRGQEVYHVTNLNNSGAGSLRDAVSQNNRTIVFDVSGAINLTSSLDIFNRSNITIAGQTAPNGGITIDGDRVFFNNVENIIVRYIRFKGGISSTTYDGGGTTSMQSKANSLNQIWDHCSFAFGKFQGGSWYETNGTAIIDNLTVQRCFFAENDRGALSGGGSGNNTITGEYSFISNAFYNVTHRTPNISGDDGKIDVINNVVWYAFNRLMQPNGNMTLNHINNYYNYNNVSINDYKFHMFKSSNGNPNIYTNGNKYIARNIGTPLVSSISEININNTLAFKWFVGASGTYGSQLPSNYFTNNQHSINGESFTILSADETYVDVSNNVGCNARLNADGSVSDNLDILDARWLENIQSGAYVSRMPQNTWVVPAIVSISRDNNFYQSNAHIPEIWFQANVPSGQDHNDIAPSGYTWLEEYLNQVDTPSISIGVEGVEVLPSTAEIQIPDTISLTATITPSNATNQNGVWTSSDESIATVDSNGVVTPVSVGVVTITFTTSDGGFIDTSQITVFPEALVASAGTDQQICEGESTTLTASGGTNYLWSTGETTDNIEVTPNVTTTYTVTVSNDTGEFDDASVIVTVNPLPVADAGIDQTICEGESVTLTANGGDSYLWSTGETTASIDVDPGSETIYNVEVISNDCSSSDSVTVFVNAAPNISVSGDVVIVDGESTTLVASGSDNYLWSTGETTSFIDVTPLVTTTYNVSSIGLNGCQSNVDVTVTVIPEVIADAGTDSVICRGESVVLNATGGGTYLWNTGDTTPELTVSPTITTTYTVTVEDDYGYTDTDSVTITVNETPDITVSNDVVIFDGESTTLVASGGNNYQWSTGETTESIIVSPISTTTYTVISTAVGGCADIEQVTVTVIPEVVADAGEDATICNGESITLNASGGSTYVWNTGGTVANPIVSPEITTTYTVTVEDDYGNTDSDSVTITVNETPDITVSNDVTIMDGESTVLTANGGDNYQWSTGETVATISVSPDVTTIYTVSSVGVSGCEDTEQVTVTVIPELIANAGDDTELCSGESITLNASGGIIYTWNTGDTDSQITVSPTVTTTYTVTVEDDYGNIDTDTVTVTVNETPIVIISQDITIIEGESTNLTVTGAETYQWNTGETTSSITVSPTQTTTYTVIGTSNACSVEVQVTVTVDELFEVSAGEDKHVCDNDTYEVALTATQGDSYLWSTGETTQTIVVSPVSTSTYTVTVTEGVQQDTDEVTVYVDLSPDVVIVNGDSVDIMDGDFVTLSATGANSYEWNNGATQPNIAVSPSTTTTYEVKGYVGDCYDEKQVTVNVIPEVIADAGDDVEICLGEVTTLSAAGDDGEYEYEWSTGETTQSIQVSPTVTTEYTVTVFNAVDFDEDSVVVEVDLNCDEEGGEESEIPIEEVEDFEFDIFPNPATDIVNLKLSGSNILTNVYLYDITGKLIHRVRISNEDLSSSSTTQIDVSALQQGIYYIRLVDVNRELSKKLIVN